MKITYLKLIGQTITAYETTLAANNVGAIGITIRHAWGNTVVTLQL